MNRSQNTIPPANRKLRVCVTGGIACGKSLAGAMLAELGAAVIDADAVYHALMKAGRPLFKRLVAAFGKTCVGADGEIDRRTLGRMIFADAGKLRRLNRLVHPEVKRVINAWFAKQFAGRGRRRVAVALVPLVYEAGWEGAWERIVCVGSPASVQAARLQSRGLTAAAARARIAAQWPVDRKMRQADYVVFNGGSRGCVRRQIVVILKDIMQPEEK